MDVGDAFFNGQVMLRSFPILMRGVGNTILLGFATIFCGSIAGLAICLIRLYGPRLLQLLAIGFIDIFRALPALVTLVLIYYALPFLGISLPSFTAATLALSIVFASFFAEICRAGIDSIPKAQFEAALRIMPDYAPARQNLAAIQALEAQAPPPR